jgi:hypothetical protein
MPESSHFSEEDVAAIFQAANKAQVEARSKLGRREGLTLDELKEIGAEVGITPEFIEQAAASRKMQVVVRPDKRVLGIPVSVERILPLPRQLSNDEWGLLVADLRDTFAARGTVAEGGSLRQWTNGNLSATIEPAPSGAYQLRLRTRKGNAEGGLAIGGVLAIFGVLWTTLLLLKDLPQDPSRFAVAAFFIIAALAAFSFTAITVPQWHRGRSRQFDQIASRAAAMVSVGAVQDDLAAASAEPDLLAVDPRSGNLLDVDLEKTPTDTNEGGRRPDRTR